ncbi:MAG: hypothetical protein HC816_02215 [Leptolyngbyaceae cyanobacterium RM1_1_2]|nr:hypothetical protein [Leptolyngbyaceae cyanobacterium RM1_1_2]
MKLSQVRTGWLAQLKEVYRLDLRSLALLRLGLGVTLLMAIVHRFSLGLTDEIVAGPRSLLVEDRLWLGQLSELLAGLPWLQGGLLLLTAIAALCLLVGYKTRKAAIAAWILVSFWPDSAFLSGTEALLPSALFWGMFLPLGASYAVDSALNPQQMALPRSLFSAATVALMVRQCFVYGFLAQRLAGLRTGPESLTPLANGLLAADLAQLSPAVFWILLAGPLLLWLPVGTVYLRLLAIVGLGLLPLGLALIVPAGLVWLNLVTWLAFLPTAIWQSLTRRCYGPPQAGLTIYFDADCGFCKKVVHLLRTFLLLPSTPLLMAQSDSSICADMEAQNSWVVVDWQGDRYFKFEAIAYMSAFLRSLDFWFRCCAGHR